jgi:transcription elongation GreA/GreB family factor
MTIVAPEQRLASAYAVCHGRRGAVTRHARRRGVTRQRVYREAAWVRRRLGDDPLRQENAALRQRLRAAEERLGQLQARLGQAVVLDGEKQAELAAAG